MLKVKNVYKTFNPNSANEVRALRGISLDIKEGDFVCVLGTNGSGKSTMLNAVAGTFAIDEGSISLTGKDITKMPEHKRARYVGRVFQNPFSGTAPDMTIAENIAIASMRGKNRGFRQALRRSSTSDFLASVSSLNMGLEGRLDNIIGKLSGGQRQALTLLMATWLKPELLLLDEHTAALDPKTAGKVISLTKKLVEENNLTTMMVTHSMQQAVNLGNRILMLHKGKVAYDIKGEDKKRLRVNDLPALFDDIRKKEQINESVASMIEKQYI